ncbi:uncharacterized protein STEHIDRAFT_159200 [Stereum hirsutum FP-91666 SS1]|uniref:uncharacterized protein n=1 Tax=Stereum hirsutum (strain FP-91666) TaxID=721885 RepID=UPI0004449DAD|nr:uncharacterized protein STEHIDRAFT_159200 [Stereum hirsutum FP-91666 SS1]EIM84531.1 hypothetical protein STEHIDRAFT_159200 [Stereum hirsutum FP-91666 SS1]
MFTHLNLSHITATQNIDEANIGCERTHTSPQSVQSDQPLIAERPTGGPHVLLPSCYPVFVESFEPEEGEVEWMVVTKPIHKIGMGSKVIGMSRGEGCLATAEVEGEVTGVERYDRDHVVFKVKGGSGMEWKMAVRYSHAIIGICQRLRVLFTIDTDHHPPKSDRSWMEDWISCFCGPLGSMDGAK